METQPSSSNQRIKIVAEVGCNHAGNLNAACDMIAKAKLAGADAVKFQSYRTDQLVNPEGIEDFCRKSELSEDDHRILMAECDERDIEFMSSAFDLESFYMLCELDVQTIKIPSGQLPNHVLLRAAAESGRTIYLSTGMSDWSDVVTSVELMRAHGMDMDKFVLMQCTSAYPCPPEAVNLRVLDTYSKVFKCRVGYSDHAESTAAAILSVAFGVSVIEHHFILGLVSLERYDIAETPDEPVSLPPFPFKVMVDRIRQAEKSLGSGIKFVHEAEEPMLHRRDVQL